jgi:hypothetical protein
MATRPRPGTTWATAIEYGLIAALVAVAIITALTTLGKSSKTSSASPPAQTQQQK